MDEFRYKIVVELDDEKLKQERYVLDDCYRIVREQFVDDNLIDVSQNSRELAFISKPDGKDEYAKIGLASITLWDSWFRPYLKKILWYTNPLNGSQITVEEGVSEFRKYEQKYGRVVPE